MDVVERWARHLRATGRKPRTIVSYRSDIEQFRQHASSDDLLAVTGDDIVAFLELMRSEGLSVATATRRYRSLHQFYGWLHAKREIRVDPTAAVTAPSGLDVADVLSPRELAALLGACADANTSGRHGRVGVFEARRDTAIVVLLMTTGMTASELIGLDVDDVRVDSNEVRVHGRCARLIPILSLPTEALGRYLQQRDAHRHAFETESLWLGERGSLTTSGLRQLLDRRSAMAGLRHVTSGQFRRSFARDSLGRGMSELELAELGGWGSARSVRRFGRGAEHHHVSGAGADSRA